MTDCDIEFFKGNYYGAIRWHYDESKAPNNRQDFRHTATHEVGHCLGMGHSNRQSAVMYGSSTPGTGDDDRHLHDDDATGIQQIYGGVAPDLALVTVTQEGKAKPGKTVDLIVEIENVGSGPAYALLAEISSTANKLVVAVDEIDLGHLGSDTPVGARLSQPTMSFTIPLSVDESCHKDKTVDVLISLSDALGQTWEISQPVDLLCFVEEEVEEISVTDTGSVGAGYSDEVAAGCGCTVAGSEGRSGAAWMAGFMVLLAGCRRGRL